MRQVFAHKHMDLTVGDPLLPLKGVADYAFREAQQELNVYQHVGSYSSQAFSAPDTVLGRMHVPVAAYFSRRFPTAQIFANNVFPVEGGATGAFNLVLQMLAQDVDAENRNNKRCIKPAILMPVPTFGLFKQAAGSYGFTVIKVARNLDEGGMLSAEAVNQAIQKAHQSGLRVVSYYDSNPQAPMGLVRQWDETRQLAGIFRKINETYATEDLDFSARRQTPVFSGPASRIFCIDDMVYDGLEYTSVRPASFIEMQDMAQNAVALFSLSKIGLVGLRAGLAVGHENIICRLHELQMRSCYFPSTPALHALQYYFSNEDVSAELREKHLDKLREAYYFAGLLLKALVNGLQNVPEATTAEHARMRHVLVQQRKYTQKEADALLANGIPGLKIITMPQAGFYHMLDFSALGTNEKEILQELETNYGIKLGLSRWYGLTPETRVSRVHCAMERREIVELAERLAAFAGKRMQMSISLRRQQHR